MGVPSRVDVESGDGGGDVKLLRPVTLRLVLPVVVFTLLAQMLSVFVTSGYVSARVEVPHYEPFGNSVQGSVGNSLVLVASVFMVTVFMVWLVKTKRFNLIKRFLTVFVSFSAFFFTQILGDVLLMGAVGYEYVSQVSVMMGVAAALLVGYSSLKPKHRLLGVVASLIMSVEVAVYLAIFIRPPTIFVLPVVFALYDLYAVFMGPLKTLISSSERFVLAPLVARLGDLEIGLGDIAFYSLIPSASLLLVGLSGVLVTVVATNLGLLITLRMLKHRPNFPGLPIPVLLGTVGLLLLTV